MSFQETGMSNIETIKSLEEAVQNLTEWLEGAALPLWSTAGVEQTTGGFHERIAQDGRPMVEDNRRAASSRARFTVSAPPINAASRAIGRPLLETA